MPVSNPWTHRAADRDSVVVAIVAVGVAVWLWGRRRLALPKWEEVLLEQQQLWTGIDSYYRTPGPTESVGPVLSFRSAKGGLGDPGTMASIAARFHPRATDVHIVTCEAAGKSFIPFCCSDEGLASWFNHSATPPAVGCSGWAVRLCACVCVCVRASSAPPWHMLLTGDRRHAVTV